MYKPSVSFFFQWHVETAEDLAAVIVFAADHYCALGKQREAEEHIDLWGARWGNALFVYPGKNLDKSAASSSSDVYTSTVF